MLPYLIAFGIPAGYVLGARLTYGYRAWHPDEEDTENLRMAIAALWPLFWLLMLGYGVTVLVSAGWVVREIEQPAPVQEPAPAPASCPWSDCTEPPAYGSYCSKDHYLRAAERRHNKQTIAEVNAMNWK